MIPLSYNLRNLRVRRATSLATAFGVGLVVFVLAAALMLSAGLERTMMTSGSEDTAIVLRKGNDAEMSSVIEDNLIGIIKAAPGVAAAEAGGTSAVGEVAVVMFMRTVDGKGSSNVMLRGVPDNVAAFRPEMRIIEGRPAKPGTNEVVVGKRIAGRFKGLSIGETIELRKNRPAEVVGIFETGGSSFESEVWGDVFVVREAFGRPGVVSSVRVRLESPEAFDTFEATVEQDQRLALEAMEEIEFFQIQSQNTAIFITAVGIMITIFFSVGAMIGAMITMYGAVSARKSEIGVLRALGFSRTAIMLSFLFESFVLSLAGGALGAAAAIALGWVEFSILNFQTFSEIVFKFEPEPGILITASVFGGVMGIFGGFLPALRAAHISAIEAMRG